MEENIQLDMDLGKICGKRVVGKFDAGKLSSDGGAIFLSRIEEKVGIIDRLCKAIIDRRDRRYIDHSYKELLSQRIYQIACNYKDANDCNTLRSDPVLNKVLKIGTRVEELVTKVRFHFPTNYPFKGIIGVLCKNLIFSTA